MSCLNGDCLLNLLAINTTLPIDEDFPKWILILIFVQVILLMVGIYGMFLFSFVFRKKTLMHPNLKILSMNTAFLWFMVVLCRLVVAIGSLINFRLIAIQSNHVVMKPFIFIELLRVACGYAALFSIGSLVLERIVATVYLGVYERRQHPILMTLIIILIWLFGIISCGLAYGRARASLFTIMGLFINVLFVGGGYYFVVRTNKRRLKQSKIYSFQYTLSQRYQIKENLRVINIFKKCVKTFIPAMIFLGFIWTTLAIIYLNYKHSTFYYLMREISHLSSCFCACLILYSFATGTHLWRQEFQEIFQRLHQFFCIKKGRSKEKIAPKATLVNSDGHEIGGFDQEKEKHIHFSQLELQWSV